MTNKDPEWIIVTTRPGCFPSTNIYENKELALESFDLRSPSKEETIYLAVVVKKKGKWADE